MKLVTAAQQLHGILDNTANNKVLECELRLYALQTILHDNITHVSPHVAPPPSLDIVAYRDPGTTSCTTSSHLNSNANITATPAAAPDSALAAAAGVAAAFAHAVFATSAVAAAFTSARTPATLAAVPVAQHTACASAYAAAPAAFLLTAACVAGAAFVPGPSVFDLPVSAPPPAPSEGPAPPIQKTKTTRRRREILVKSL